MVKLLYKSKLMRAEIKHWISLIALFMWAVASTLWALSKSNRILVIGMDEAGTRIISQSSDRLIQNELKSFLKYFLEKYYFFDEGSFSENMKLATDLFSNDLWEREKAKILKISENLKKSPLQQTMSLESIDRIDNETIEALLNLKIKARMNEQIVRLKVQIKYRRIERSEGNPWGFEITDITDERL